MSKKENKKVEEPSETYELTSKNEDIEQKLHPILVKLLEKSIKQADEGKLISHEEVKRLTREKYPFLK